jgi:Icc protein
VKKQIKNSLRCLTLCFTIICIASCKKFEANPYSTQLPEELPSQLNKHNLDLLTTREHDEQDTVRFIFTGDTQRFYEELKDLVTMVNTLSGIHFVIVAGDITDFGLTKEFQWIYEHLNRLNVPYIGVVGNHDLSGNGTALYEKIFGPKNFSFRFKGTKFICHDTNSREYNYNGQVPDLSFINAEISDSTAEHFVGVSHVPPFNGDFDPAMENDYSKLLASDPRFLLSLHGHLHGTYDSTKYNDHVRYIVTPTVQKRYAFLLKIHKGKVYKQSLYF